jgi:hypothetical protein
MCGKESDVPKITSAGASIAGEDIPATAVAAVPVAVAGEHGPELTKPLAGDGVVPVPHDGTEAVGSTENPPAPGQPIEEPIEELSAADRAAGYTELSYAQLRAEAKSRGLPTGGTAVDLAARLGEHDQTAAEPVAPTGDGK